MTLVSGHDETGVGDQRTTEVPRPEGSTRGETVRQRRTGGSSTSERGQWTVVGDVVPQRFGTTRTGPSVPYFTLPIGVTLGRLSDPYPQVGSEKLRKIHLGTPSWSVPLESCPGRIRVGVVFKDDSVTTVDH